MKYSPKPIVASTGKLCVTLASNAQVISEIANLQILLLSSFLSSLHFVLGSSGWYNYTHVLLPGNNVVTWNYHQVKARTVGRVKISLFLPYSYYQWLCLCLVFFYLFQAVVRRIEIFGAAIGGATAWSLRACGNGTYSSGKGSPVCVPCKPGFHNPHGLASTAVS